MNDDAIVGEPLPSLVLGSTEKATFSIPGDLEGRWSILYFYPKDDTPGCTTQACNYRDNMASFAEADIAVYGVSMDSIESHQKFQKKHGFDFPLLADVNHELSSALNVYGDKEFAGKRTKGLSRDTFLIDPSGVVRKVWRRVSPKSTVAETYEEAVAMKNEGR